MAIFLSAQAFNYTYAAIASVATIWLALLVLSTVAAVISTTPLQLKNTALILFLIEHSRANTVDGMN